MTRSKNDTTSRRVFRGGGWSDSDTGRVSAADRHWIAPTFSYVKVGFRVTLPVRQPR